MNKKYTVRVETDPEDPDNLILPLPDEMLEELNWKEGDTLCWEDNLNGSYTLRKKDQE